MILQIFAGEAGLVCIICSLYTCAIVICNELLLTYLLTSLQIKRRNADQLLLRIKANVSRHSIHSRQLCTADRRRTTQR